MTLYANFQKGYSHRLDGIDSIVCDENWLTLLDKKGGILASFSHQWITNITKKPHFTCYTEDRIAAASQADTHPDKMVWSDDGGWHVKVW